MVGILGGRPGEILTLRAFIAEHETEVTADLLSAGHHLYDLGDALSWREFECWLKHLAPHTVTVQKLRALAVEEAKPEDERTVGTKPGSAIPIDELNSWLGWDDDPEGGEAHAD